jgi:integrase
MRKPSRLPPYTYEDTDRRGNVRVYFRKPGRPKVRLHGVAWTPKFMAQYETAMNGNITPEVSKFGKTKPETWRWLCECYIASGWFKKLRGTTPNTRRKILESTWAEPIAPDSKMLFGEMPVSRLTPKAVRVLRDRKAGFATAGYDRLKVMSYVFKYGLEEHAEIVSTNPVRDVMRSKPKTAGHHPWTNAQFLQFMKAYAPGTKERRAMSLMLYTGARGCDAREFGPQHIKDGRFVFTQQKTGDWVDVPVLDDLATELALAPKTDLAYILTEYGKTFSQKGFGQWFNEKARKAGLVNCTAHGVRKGAATIAANNGATVHQLMAMFGWMSLAMAIHYTKAVDRRKLADAGMGFIRLEQNAS